jgi:hypothetical protein
LQNIGKLLATGCEDRRAHGFYWPQTAAVVRLAAGLLNGHSALSPVEILFHVSHFAVSGKLATGLRIVSIRANRNFLTVNHKLI